MKEPGILCTSVDLSFQPTLLSERAGWQNLLFFHVLSIRCITLKALILPNTSTNTYLLIHCCGLLNWWLPTKWKTIYFPKEELSPIVFILQLKHSNK